MIWLENSNLVGYKVEAAGSCAVEMEKFMKGLMQVIGVLMVVVAVIMAVASIPFLGPIPASMVFGIGYVAYRSFK